jgi:hypothetical protein
MAKIVLKVNCQDISFSSDLYENEQDAIRNEIYPMFNSYNINNINNINGHVAGDDRGEGDGNEDEADNAFYNIYILKNGNLDTNSPTTQIPTQVYTIYPKHPSFNNKHVQFRFKLDSESSQVTQTRNLNFDSSLPFSSSSSSFTSHAARIERQPSTRPVRESAIGSAATRSWSIDEYDEND